MKKITRILSKIITVCLMLALSVGIIAPLTTVEAEAKTVNYVSVPASTVSISKIHAATNLVGAIGTTVKGIGALKYASDNAKDLGEFLDMALDYFSGNAQENERLDSIEETMLAQFELTNQSLVDIRADIANLSSQIESVQSSIQNQSAYNYLKLRLDAFYTDYFFTKYKELKEAYEEVEKINNGTSDVANLQKKMNILYAKALELKELSSYITGENELTGMTMIDAYFEYVMRVNNITSTDNPLYAEKLEQCQNFALQLYAADAFQRYCLAYTSAYQLNCIQQTGKDYLIDSNHVSVPGGTYELSKGEVLSHIDTAHNGIANVSASIADSLSALYHLSAFVGYTEDGFEYYAPTKDGAPVSDTTIANNRILNAYTNSDYHFYSLSDDLEALFINDFAFVIEGNVSSKITSTGNLDILDPVGTSFTVSYVYGKNRLKTPVKIYSVDVVISERSLGGGYGTKEAPYLIKNADQYVTFASNTAYHGTSVYTKLVADIDISGKSAKTVSNFYGVFDGGNRTVSGFTGSCAPFSYNYGTIRNVTYSASKISDKASGSGTLGGIADINNSLIENCHLKNSTLENYRHNYKGPSTGYTSFACNIGGIAGENKGTIKHSSVVGSTIKGTVSTHELYTAGYLFMDGSKYDMTSYTYIYIGGAVGDSSGTVDGCFVANTTISSETKARYHKDYKTFWVYTYNRVKGTVSHGITVGLNSGSVTNCTYNNVSDSDSNHNIYRHADDETDESFATLSKSSGANGTTTASTSISPYFTSIKVLYHPSNSDYMKNTAFNYAGLEVIDSNKDSIYGYSVSNVTISEHKTYVITVSYQGKSATFEITSNCLHYNTEYERTVPATCISDGIAKGFYCNDCGYSDGKAVIARSTAYCYDSDNDHNCQLCQRSLSECKDETSDHKCDICSKVITICIDTDNDHNCNTCSARITDCSDDDDHMCDVCGVKISSCKDDSKDHNCDVCGQTLSTCLDSDDHLCDICGEKISDCIDMNSDYLCDVCDANLCTHVDSDNDHICNVCSRKCSECTDMTNDHFCDICTARLSYCSDSDDHYCDLCSAKLGDCTDGNSDHTCDVCKKIISSCDDFIVKDHLCDICGKKMTEHTDLDQNHICEWCLAKASECVDMTLDHRCDICNQIVSTCLDADKNHACDICSLPMGIHAAAPGGHNCSYCSAQVTSCADTDNDHLCNVCNKKISDHVDNDRNHICDICVQIFTVCLDEDKNHACDICSLPMGTHATAANNHYCSYCSEKMTNCLDVDKNHFCDVCNEKTSEHIDMDNNHVCEYCSGKASDHYDNDDHYCDICFIELSKCQDKNADHLCDLCQQKLTEHADGDSDHLCDLCKARISKHKDEDKNDYCDVCSVDVKNHKDDDGDGLCDICLEEYVKKELGAGAIFLIVIGVIAGIALLAVGAYYLFDRIFFY